MKLLSSFTHPIHSVKLFDSFNHTIYRVKLLNSFTHPIHSVKLFDSFNHTIYRVKLLNSFTLTIYRMKPNNIFARLRICRADKYLFAKFFYIYVCILGNMFYLLHVCSFHFFHLLCMDIFLCFLSKYLSLLKVILHCWIIRFCLQ